MSDLLGSRDILYPANFDCFGHIGTFSTATPDCNSQHFMGGTLVGSYHKERDPRERCRVIQEMSDSRRNQAPAAQ